ncbi:MAG TPA: TIGR03089 family protein [Pseudonocardia sp.]|jgi:uncharacterized protein (TIGR03089 family)|nr:TIGR03089 family protein [Pseudonocardia sp.]
MTSQTLTDALLAPRLSSDAAQPLITYYDDATGERIELSGTTSANWAAKTANLLRDECDLEPGGTVSVLLPAHWQTLAVLLGAWWCGGEVVTDPAGADVVLTDLAHLDEATGAGAGVVVALSLHALGAGLTDLPAGVVDYATEVRLHGDTFVAEPEAGSGPVLDGRDAASVLEAARAAGAELPAGARVMTSREWSTTDGLIEVPLAVLVTGGSLVQCRNLDEASVDRRAESERVTYRLR